jgi:hypothetical protein
MAFLPRLARALNKPGIATMLGLVLVAVAIIGMTSGDIPMLGAGLCVGIFAVGVAVLSSGSCVR